MGGVEAAREVYFRVEDHFYRNLGGEGYFTLSVDHSGGEEARDLVRRSLLSSGDVNRMRPRISGCVPISGGDISERLIKAVEKVKHTASKDSR